jgi:hypothetical protein
MTTDWLIRRERQFRSRSPCRLVGGALEQLEVARAKVATVRTFAESPPSQSLAGERNPTRSDDAVVSVSDQSSPSCSFLPVKLDQ